MDRYSSLGADGFRKIILSRVIIGNMTIGCKDEIMPQTFSGRRYDTMVNDLNNPQIFVIGSDFQAYPEFVVTVKQNM